MYITGIPAGILVDSKGPKPPLILGALLLFFGYFPIYQGVSVGAVFVGSGTMLRDFSIRSRQGLNVSGSIMFLFRPYWSRYVTESQVEVHGGMLSL